MAKKILQVYLFFTYVSVFTIVACTQTAPIEVSKSENKKFFVDSKNGNDCNDGSSIETPWKTLYNINIRKHEPGDSLFLKCGSSWEDGRLVLKGSGTLEEPIVLTTYGNGVKPHIKGNGKVDQVILLENVECWKINNIEISNSATTIGNRTGILVKTLLPGSKRLFHITNCYIHDIMGDYSMETKGKNTGGIGIIGGSNTKFDDILIEGNEIGNINRVGIFTTMMNASNTIQLNSVQGKRPITNLIVRNNKIHHCTGDGAIIRNTYKAVISHNTAWENHNGPEGLVRAGVALWCRSTDETLFEYNEVYNTRGELDGQAFDTDLDCFNTIIQYNYSHGNEGGFYLCYGSSNDAIVRYNVSVNDGVRGKHIFDFPIWTNPRGNGIFHNNTVIISKDIEAVIADEALETARFYNNIFYNLGSGKLYVESQNTTAFFKNNVYIGYDVATISDTNPFFEDPLIVSPLKDNIGMDNLKNFKLKSKSPYFNKGINVKEIEGENYWLPASLIDFGGKPLQSGKIPIGAFQD